MTFLLGGAVSEIGKVEQPMGYTELEVVIWRLEPGCVAIEPFNSCMRH